MSRSGGVGVGCRSRTWLLAVLSSWVGVSVWWGLSLMLWRVVVRWGCLLMGGVCCMRWLLVFLMRCSWTP